jgi:hypothetical protein
MKLTKKQLRDLVVIEYFIPLTMRKIEITEQDIEDFFAYSDRGEHKKRALNVYAMDGFNALCQGKRWRGIHIHEMWEPGILDVPISVLIEDMPIIVKEYVAKEFHKGKCSHAILI